MGILGAVVFAFGVGKRAPAPVSFPFAPSWRPIRGGCAAFFRQSRKLAENPRQLCGFFFLPKSKIGRNAKLWTRKAPLCDVCALLHQKMHFSTSWRVKLSNGRLGLQAWDGWLMVKERIETAGRPALTSASDWGFGPAIAVPIGRWACPAGCTRSGGG